MKKIKKYLLVEEKDNGFYKVIDASYSKSMILNLQKIHKKLVNKHYKIIIIKK